MTELPLFEDLSEKFHSELRNRVHLFLKNWFILTKSMLLLLYLIVFHSLCWLPGSAEANFGSSLTKQIRLNFFSFHYNSSLKF